MDASPFTPTAAPLQSSQAYMNMDNTNNGDHTTTLATPDRAMMQQQQQSTTPAFSPPITRRSTGASSSLDDATPLDASSPFITNVADNTSQASSNQENSSPSKDKRRSRIMTGSEMTPLRMLQRSNSEASSTASNQAVAQSMASDEMLAPPKSPRKSISPMRRFPVRINTAGGMESGSPRGGGGSGGSGTGSRPNSIPPPVRERDEPPEEQQPQQPHHHRHQSDNEDVRMTTTTHQTNEMDISLDEAIAQNPGVKHAIEIFEDALDTMDEDDDEFHMARDNVTGEVVNGFDAQQQNHHQQNGVAAESFDDDTIMSEFSEFSAIPSMTTFARLGGKTPAQAGHDHTKGSLLDFTDNLRFPGGRASSPPKTMMTSTTPMADAKKTPNRQSIANLLDFEIPPMPTPRSVPSISARELESLKSQFMSEISSLKATLSGKEAEAASLKTALMDAEKRAGETGEQLREERSMREQYHEEKETWEKRGREMETVLRQVKDEIMSTQREREALEARLEESEGRREAAEMMAQEAESKMAAMRASKVGAGGNGGGGDMLNSPAGLRSPKGVASQREIELAVEKVARELHAAYKSKHESKVAALKKNYENRWDKKIREMEAKIDELTKENEGLRAGRDATLNKVELEAGERRDQAVRDSAQIKGLHAEVVKLEAVLRTIQDDNQSLRQQLEVERVEKGELVTLAEELMQMQANQTTMMQDVEHTHPEYQQQQQQQHLYQQHEEQQQEEYGQPTPAERTTPPKRSMPQRASAPVPARSQAMGLSRSATTTTPRKTAISPSGYGPSGQASQAVPASKPNYRHSVIGRPSAAGAGGGGGLTSGLRAPSRIGGVSGAGGSGVPHQRTQSGIARPGSGLARPASSLARPSGLMSSIQQMGGGGGGNGGYYRGSRGE